MRPSAAASFKPGGDHILESQQTVAEKWVGIVDIVIVFLPILKQKGHIGLLRQRAVAVAAEGRQ